MIKIATVLRKKVTCKGKTNKQVDISRAKCVELLSTVANDKPNLEFNEVVYIGKENVARIIGSKGSVIRALQVVSGARIHIDQHGLSSIDSPRLLCLYGKRNETGHAKRVVQTLVQVEGEQYKDQVSALFEIASYASITTTDMFDMNFRKLQGRWEAWTHNNLINKYPIRSYGNFAT